MRQCKTTIWGRERCPNEAEEGYSYCSEHKTRKKAIEERDEKNLGTIIDATQVFEAESPKTDLVKKPDNELARRDTPIDQQNIYDKVQHELNGMIEWENTTREWMLGLNKEEIRYQDKAGAEQLHSFVTLYERAQDRVLRGVTAVAKLGIDAQSVNVNKMLRELIKSCLARALKKYGMSDPEIEQVRRLLSEEFEQVDREAS